MRSVLSLSFAAIVTLAPAAGADCLFVNNNDDPNSVSAFAVGAGGVLTPAPGSPFATGDSSDFRAHVDSLALLPGGARLYASNAPQGGDAPAGRSRTAGEAPSGGGGIAGSVSGFDIGADCSLTSIAGSPWTAGSSPTGVAIDPAGSRLYVANFDDDTISVFSIDAGGALAPLAFSPIATPESPFDLEFSPDGGRLFVSQDFADAVSVYDVAGDGSLTAVAGSPFAAGGTEHGLGLDPSGSRSYISDLNPNTISGYSIGGGGALTPLGGSPFGAGEVIEVLVAPGGGYLFASNNEDNTIGAYSVDGGGALAQVAGSPFGSDGTGPAGLATDPTGTYLFVSYGGFGGSNDVGVYAIGAGGGITPITGSPFATGGITGGAMGIAYYDSSVFSPVTWVDVPALGPAGLAILAGLLALASAFALRRRARA